MAGPKPSALARLAVSLTMVVVAGCSGGPERPLLKQFFNASRIRDRSSLQNFAMVSFEPRTDGIVTAFTITNVTPEQREPVDVKVRPSAVVALSVDDPRTPFDLTRYDVELASKDVTVSAPVKLPSGETSNRILVVTMQRGVLKGKQPRTGRWIVTAVKDAAASPSGPLRR